MSTLEEIRKMMREGRSGDEIAGTLQQRGVPMQEIENAFSQAQIKEAITAPSMDEAQISTPPIPQAPRFDEQPIVEEVSELDNGMNPSVMQEEQGAAAYPPTPETVQGPGQGYYQEPEPYDYSQYGQSPQISADTISEIAEQVVSEKLSKMRTKIDKAIDLKSSTEASLIHLNERLQRIEKIIDNLQMSILQRVGEYTNNVSDIKKELIETQKSFSAMSNEKTEHHKGQHKHKT